jgi:SAM-dependent methyltransferase
LHHIPSKELRIQFLKEIKRILGPKGTVIISVWRFPLARKIRFSLKSFFLRKNLDWGDALVPWRGELLRYVHMFSEKELIRLFRQAGFEIIELKKIKRAKRGESNLLMILRNPR